MTATGTGTGDIFHGILMGMYLCALAVIAFLFVPVHMLTLPEVTLISTTASTKCTCALGC